MRVVHVIPGLAARTGGVATALVELAHGLTATGVETTILSTDLDATAGAASRCPVDGGSLAAGLDGLDTRLYPACTPRRLAFSPALARAVRREAANADVVHTHGLWLHPAFAAWRAAENARVAHVVCPQGMLDPALAARGRMRKAATSLAWQNRMLAGAAAIQFTAGEEAHLAAHVAPQTPRCVLPNPIRWDSYQDGDGSAFRASHLDGFDGPLVLNLGRIARKKGLDVLVEAFALVAARIPAARLALVGPDDEGLTPGLERRAAELGVRERVSIVPMLVGAEKRDALAAADVWALPTRSDACASAVSEALAAGRAVVLSPQANAAPELCAAGAALVRAAEPTAFAEAIVDLLRDADARTRLGRRARAFARRYDRALVARDAVRMYERAVASREVVRAQL